MSRVETPGSARRRSFKHENAELWMHPRSTFHHKLHFTYWASHMTAGSQIRLLSVLRHDQKKVLGWLFTGNVFNMTTGNTEAAILFSYILGHLAFLILQSIGTRLSF